MPAINSYRVEHMPLVLPLYRNPKQYNESPVTAYGDVISFPSTIVKGQLSVTHKGVTVTNKLGTKGEIESTDDFTASDVTLSLDTDNEMYGTNALKLTLDAEKTSGYAEIDIKSLLIAGEYYLISAYVKVGTAAGITMSLQTDDQDVAASALTATTYGRTGIVIAPTDFDTATVATLRFAITDAAGETAYIDGIMINKITSAEYALGATALMARYNYVSGTKSTVCGIRGTSVGKNQCPTDVDDWEQGSVSTVTGEVADSSSNIRTKKYYRISSSVITSSRSGTDLLYVMFFDANKNYITYHGNPVNQTMPTNAFYIRYRIARSGGDILPKEVLNIKPQVEYSSAVTTYKPFVENIQYIAAKDDEGNIEELRSVPNGTKDEISDGQLTKRVSDTLIINGSHVAATYDETTLTYAIRSNANLAPNSVATTANTVNALSSDGNYPCTGIQLADYRSISIYSGLFYIRVEKTKIDAQEGVTTLDKFKAYLNLYPITINYQLAVPVETPVPKQELICYPGGTLTYSPEVMYQMEEYGTGIAIEDETVPIQTLKYCYKLNLETGEYTDVLSDATVAVDGLSFTVSGLEATDIVEYGYEYDSALTTLPITEYSTPLGVTMPIPLTGEGNLFDPVWIGTVNRLVVK